MKIADVSATQPTPSCKAVPSPNEAAQVVHSSGRITLAATLKKLMDFRGGPHLCGRLLFPQREDLGAVPKAPRNGKIC